VWPATAKEFSACEFIVVRRTLSKLQLFQRLNRGQLIIFPMLVILSRSRQNPTRCLVKVDFSDEARALARLSISRARLFFISVQKMNRKKRLDNIDLVTR
jgi:hypothetical protein